MAVLTASPPAFTLDTLVARARAVQSVRAPSASKPKPPRPAPSTLAELERASSLGSLQPHPTQELAKPTALALWITIRRCACGSVTRCPPDYALTKYAANEHSFHYSRAGLDALPRDLPRELREKEVVIPFCESCFDAQ